MGYIGYKVAAESFDTRKLLCHLVEVSLKSAVLIRTVLTYSYGEIASCDFGSRHTQVVYRLKHGASHESGDYRTQHDTGHKCHNCDKVDYPENILTVESIHADVSVFYPGYHNCTGYYALGADIVSCFVDVINMSLNFLAVGFKYSDII